MESPLRMRVPLSPKTKNLKVNVQFLISHWCSQKSKEEEEEEEEEEENLSTTIQGAPNGMLNEEDSFLMS